MVLCTSVHKFFFCGLTILISSGCQDHVGESTDLPDFFVFLMWMDLELFAQVRLEEEPAKFFALLCLGSCDTFVP